MVLSRDSVVQREPRERILLALFVCADFMVYLDYDDFGYVAHFVVALVISLDASFVGCEGSLFDPSTPQVTS